MQENSRRLISHEVWKVTYVSLDDGYRLNDSYWSTQASAQKRSLIVHEGSYYPFTLYLDPETKKWYEVKLNEVDIDPLSKEDVLKKLTLKERKALGL
jgi:hypothetical protein